MTLMTEMMTESCKKVAFKYECKKCLYYTNRKSSWNKHIVTIKHNDDPMMTQGCKKLQKVATFHKQHKCVCGKGYSYKQGLYVHRKTCNIYSLSENNETSVSQINKHMITELTTIVKELIKGGIYNNYNNYNHNTNIINKNDIKIFLSSECSNAISIQDFVKQLSITIDDLNNTCQNRVHGIAKIIENNLKPLTLTERPMHHVEQDEWYIKDKKKGWEEDDGCRIVNEMQKGIQTKWSKIFEKEHPQWECDETATNNYIQLAQMTTREFNKDEIKVIKQNLSNKCVIKE